MQPTALPFESTTSKWVVEPWRLNQPSGSVLGLACHAHGAMVNAAAPCVGAPLASVLGQRTGRQQHWQGPHDWQGRPIGIGREAQKGITTATTTVATATATATHSHHQSTEINRPAAAALTSRGRCCLSAALAGPKRSPSVRHGMARAELISARRAAAAWSMAEADSGAKL